MSNRKPAGVADAAQGHPREWAAIEAAIDASAMADHGDATKRAQRLVGTGLLVVMLVVVWWLGV